MTITSSKLKSGVLKFGGTGTSNATGGDAFQTQATNVRLTPSTDTSGDPLETLSGDTINDTTDTTTWALAITAVQDFDDEDGFVNYCMDNAGDVVTYSWTPNADGPTFSGHVKIKPVEIGGDVNARITTDAEFACQETPTRTPAS